MPELKIVRNTPRSRDFTLYPYQSPMQHLATMHHFKQPASQQQQQQQQQFHDLSVTLPQHQLSASALQSPQVQQIQTQQQPSLPFSQQLMMNPGSGGQAAYARPNESIIQQSMYFGFD